jgi:hypothetical protein
MSAPAKGGACYLEAHVPTFSSDDGLIEWDIYQVCRSCRALGLGVKLGCPPVLPHFKTIKPHSYMLALQFKGLQESFERSFWSPTMLSLFIPAAAAMASVGGPANDTEVEALRDYMAVVFDGHFVDGQ